VKNKNRIKRRTPMKLIILSIILVLGVATAFAFGQDRTDEPTARFILPPPQAVSWSKPVECVAIATAGLYEERREKEDFDHPKLSGYMQKGIDSLSLWIEDKNLIVQVRDKKPDRYHVSRHMNKWLDASFYGADWPVSYSITLDERTGYAVWSLNEPRLYLASEYPYAQSVYMQCTN
jgi:hypothetical protein